MFIQVLLENLNESVSTWRAIHEDATLRRSAGARYEPIDADARETRKAVVAIY